MPSLHCTDIVVRYIKTPARGLHDYCDTPTPGFGVPASQAGTKTFVAKVHNQRVTIGRYPDCSLSDARKKANGVKSQDEPVARSKITFQKAYEKFKAEHIATTSARTQCDYRSILEKHFLPRLSKTRLQKITYDTITEI